MKSIIKLVFLFVLMMFAAPSTAQIWGPDRVEVTCISKVCLSPQKREQVEGYANEILAKLKNMGFSPPQKTSEGNRIGDFVKGRDGSPVIFISYNHEKEGGFASATSQCSEDGRFIDNLGWIKLGPKISTFPPHVIYWFVAHEMFHTLQYSQPAFLQAQTCGMPPWLGEGTANAVGLKMMEEHFGVGHFNPPLSTGPGPSVYGLRPYHIGFTTNIDEALAEHEPTHKNMSYKTSSFWRYIADRYHGGSMNYLARWMSHPMQGKDDWLKWVDDQLRTDQKIKTRLYMVFPDFQANFATWAPQKYKHLNQEEWREIAYDHCLEVNLSPQQASQKLNFDLEPISTRCIRVRATGISQGNVASIKIMAEDDDSRRLDNLHFGAASLSAKVRSLGKDFSCYRDSKAMGREPACIDKPFTGKHKGSHQVNSAQTKLVKTWLNQPQIPGNGALDNLYVISHTPLRPREYQHSSREKQAVSLTLGLDLTSLSSSAKGKAKRGSSTVNLKPGSPVPMKGSEDPAQIASEDRASKEAYRISKSAAAGISITDKGILSISMTDRGLDSDPENELVGGLTYTVNPYDLTIPFGSKGKFPAKLTTAFEINRILDPNSIIVPVPEEQAMGSIDVIEFSDELLHLEVKGNYCRIGNLDKKTGKCNKIETVEGTIIKPFGWAYDGGQDFVSIDTPGMAEYRRMLSSALSVSSVFPFPLPDIPGMTPDMMDMGSTSGGGSEIPACIRLPEGVSHDGYSPDVKFCDDLTQSTNSKPESDQFTLTDPSEADCSCSCAEKKAVSGLSDQLMNVPETAEGNPDMTAVNLEKLTCIFKCAREYAACK